MKLRPIIWKKLIGNDLRINKKLFKVLIQKVLSKPQKPDVLQLDIDRTFFFFAKNLEFQEILREATVMLRMFEIYRPDI